MNDSSQRAAHAAALTLLCALLAACGGGGGGGGDSTPTPANGSLAISGRPRAFVLIGQEYWFVPLATTTSNTLTFSATDLPEWASFDTTNGRIVGAPTAADVGTYDNIVISASDGRATTSLKAFSITVLAVATGSATLSWLPPTQATDGSPLTSLAGFRVYWGDESGTYADIVPLTEPGVTTHVVESLTPGTWFFTVTAVNEHGVESVFSNVVSKTVL